MKNSKAYILFLILTFLFPQAFAASIYPQFIDANTIIQHTGNNFRNCFSDSTPQFDELYVIGRIWQERQDTGYIQQTGITLESLKKKKSDINLDNILPDNRRSNMLWYVEPQIRCSVEVVQTFSTVTYQSVTDKFGNTTCEPLIYNSIIADSTRYLYLNYTDSLPPTVSDVIARADTCSCRWITSQGFAVRDYYNYDYHTVSYRWIGQPDTVIDTVGCVVMKLNRQFFNTHYEGQQSAAMGELKYIDGATEWISPTDTAFIPGAPGGGQRVAYMTWMPDTVQDTFYWNPKYSFDTTYTVLKYDIHAQTLQAAISQYNTNYKTQNTYLRADALKYVRSGNVYQLAERWDARERGFGELRQVGKKRYFTGRLVGASIISINSLGQRTLSSFTGAMSGAGNGPAAIYIHNRGTNDLYFENFQLGTRSLTVEEDEPTSMFDKVPRRYLSAAVTLEGNGQDTYIHFRGNNYLCGSAGKQTISQLYSAAIYMNVGTSDYISLTFDDVWFDNTHTGGLLKLEGSQDEQIGNTTGTYHCTASPIYSGNKHTAVTFNGGTYHLAPADNTTSNINFMIVSRRAYKSPVNDYIFPDVGSDVGDGLVYIKDGNFRMSTPLLSNPNNTPMMLADGTQYPREYYIMYFPERTYITGGTFDNCLVRTTDGDATAPDCTGSMLCPTNGTDDLFQYYIPIDKKNGQLSASLENEHDADTAGFDFSRLKPLYNENANEYYLMPYLPSRGNQLCELNEENNNQNWDILFPQGITPDLPTEDRPLLATLKHERGEDIDGTNYLGMFEINPYYPTQKNVTSPNLTETGYYTINKAVYLITWTMADRWRVKTMPFDVTDVTLIHTWATDSLGNTADPDLELDYYKKAVQTMIVKGRLGQLNDERGMNMPLWSLYQRAVTSRQPIINTDNPSSSYLPTVARAQKPLYYFGQSDTLQPSFYLLEATQTILPDGSFCRVWTIPQADSAGVIMHRGRTYAFMFPNEVERGSSGYNYWNGKYIVLEGPGQTLSGEQPNPEILSGNDIMITGNATFHTFYTNPYQRYDWDYTQQAFKRCDYTAVGWSESYILASDNAWNNNSLFGIDCITDTARNAIHNIYQSTTVTTTVTGKVLTITTSEQQQIAVFTPEGKLVQQFYLTPAGSKTLELQQGIYIVFAAKEPQPIKIICQ